MRYEFKYQFKNDLALGGVVFFMLLVTIPFHSLSEPLFHGEGRLLIVKLGTFLLSLILFILVVRMFLNRKNYLIITANSLVWGIEVKPYINWNDISHLEYDSNFDSIDFFLKSNPMHVFNLRLSRYSLDFQRFSEILSDLGHIKLIKP